MNKSRLLGATCLAVASFNASATIISVDWQTPGDNLVTRDTDSGLEWLDLSATTSRSYDDVSSKLSSGLEFAGWRYASREDVGGFFDAFGGSGLYYGGYSTRNNGLFDAVAPYWGDTYCAVYACAPGDGSSDAMTAESPRPGQQDYMTIYDLESNPASATQDYVFLSASTTYSHTSSDSLGSALVRGIAVVPTPPSVWLFGSGLLGLVGMARRKA